MTLTRRTLASLFLPLAALSAPALADDGFVLGDNFARALQAPAAATAEAAAAKAAEVKKPPSAAVQPALVPPAPKPAARPAAPAAALPVKAVEAAPVAPEPAQKSAAEAKAPDAKAPEAKALDAKAATKDSDAKAKDAKSKEAAEKAKKQPSARQLFGTVKSGAPMKARAVGWYAKGCLAGAKALEVDGPGWQVMRLSRNRMWGHPKMIALIERLARETTKAKEWPGLLIGDISQPRGGPMISGHASHQVGLDADIWLTPMPDRTLTKREREDLSATSMLASYDAVDTKVWGEGQVKLIKRAASYPEVERVLVHPALKKALCEASGTDRSWLSKVRPIFGHYYHFHIRLGCPSGSNNCQSQPPVPGGDGCDAELKDWLKRVAPKPKPPAEAAKPDKPKKQGPVKPDITLADLPPDCQDVLTSGGHVPPKERADIVDESKDAGPAQAFAATSKKAESAKPATASAAQ